MKRSRLKVLLLAFIPVAVAAAAYHGALDADLVFDDHLFLEQRCWQIHQPGELLQVPWRKDCSYRTIRYLSYALDHLLWGQRWAGFHLTNIVLHGVMVLLVFLLMRRLTRHSLAAAAAALMWGIHPVHTDVVTYMSGRRDLLTAIFFLLAWLSWPFDFKKLWRGALRVILAVFFFALALGSKEMAASLPLVVVMSLIIWPHLRRARLGEPPQVHGLRDLLGSCRVSISVAILFLVALGAFLYRGVFHSMVTTDERLWGGSLLTHVQTIPVIYTKYFELAFFPLRLYGDYSDYPLASGFGDPRVWLGGLLLLCIWAPGVLLFRRLPFLSFGLLWFGLTMLPVSQIIYHHELLAEHYLYLPLIGFAVPLSRLFMLASGQPWWRAVVPGLLALLAALAIVVIIHRNQQFESEATFARVILKHAPKAIRARLFLAHNYSNTGRLEEAEKILHGVLGEIALSHRHYRLTLKNLATTQLQMRGRLVQAEATITKMRKHDPQDPLALRLLGSLRARQGRTQEAQSLLSRALKLNPQDMEAHLHMGVLLMQMGRHEAATPHLRLAMRQMPHSAHARLQWAMLLLKQGKTAQAKATFQHTLKLDPDNLIALEQLFVLARQKRDLQEACPLFRRLQKLRPELQGVASPCPP